jgi:hypothetical protein
VGNERYSSQSSIFLVPSSLLSPPTNEPLPSIRPSFCDGKEKALRQVFALLGPIALVGWAVSVSSAEASYLGSATRTASGAIVLGSKTYMTPDGEGWGTVKPTIIFIGGDPSGYVSGIHWQHWGQKSAIGWGFTWIFKPTGGYYHTHVRAELRATGTSVSLRRLLWPTGCQKALSGAGSEHT